MSLGEYIESLKAFKGLAGDIVCHKTISGTPPCFAQDAPNLSHDLSGIIELLGIKQLYLHQTQAINRIKTGKHTVVSTPTASGKSLIYNLPVLDAIIENPNARALYLFPLKALARDQLDTVQTLLRKAGDLSGHDTQLTAAVYDGDITAYQKAKIRKAPPNILLSNPEMLHLAMLAHHHLWEDYFRNLKYVIVDEVHTYRGVMGSNMAWVFRRLQRICHLYGADPVFVFCSATIANPAELTQQLTGLNVKVVDESGSPAGRKDILLLRGLEGAAQTAIALIHSAVHRGLRTICYTQSRKITELIAIWASQRSKGLQEKISAYRAGFLPEERRSIERKLSSGELLAVVSTSALELGIDIGSLDLCILVGYPGTMMSTWQRAGRVGRAGRDSAMILIAHEDALDQYFINHPDEFFNMPPERALVNPDNQTILKNHLECAAAELSLEHTEVFLENNHVQEGIRDLEFSGKLLRSRQGNLWFAARKSPHRDVNLRGTSRSIPIFAENTKQAMGEIDRHRSFFETHEGAVYLHRGKSYVITKFDHVKGSVTAKQKKVHYYTRARSNKSTRILRLDASVTIKNTRIGFGTLKITEQVTGYDRRLVANQKSIGIVPLDLPKIEFETQGMWIEIPDRVREEIESARMHFMGGIHALEHAAIGIMPLLVMTDRNDLGGISIPFHAQIGKAAVFVYDGIPGGLGLTRQAFEQALVLLERTLAAVSSCTCETGCPACVHSPKCGSGNRPIDKFCAVRILEMILSGKHTGVCEKDIILNHTLSVPESSDPDIANKSAPAVSQPDRYAVLDIETRRSAKDVGGWHKAAKMGVSCAVLYDSKTDTFHEYLQDDIPRLCNHLKKCDLVIGFNIVRFDYKVLSGLTNFDFESLPTLDMLLKIHERLGYRLSLDHLAKETLDAGKSADGLLALEWWKQGKIDKIIDYCRQDVKVTRDLYLFGRKNQFLVFRNKAGHQVRVPVVW